MKFSSIILVVLLVVGFISGFISGSLIISPSVTVTTSGVASGTQTLKTYITVERTVTDTVILTITKTFYKTDRSIDISCIVFKTDKDVYKMSENVALILENDCDFVLMLPNSAPWRIFDSNLKELFTPIALQVIIELRPGDRREWLWNQKDNDGRKVLPGVYHIVLETINMGAVKTQIQIT